jgi:uncharacterized damage-inducible protein DinB
MTLTEVLKQEAEVSFAVTESLFRLVDDGQLGWKPATGRNWMTLGQLLLHCATAGGSGIKGFVTGDWGLPEGRSFDDLPPDQVLPPAEAMPQAKSVAEALALLADDRRVALRYLNEAGEQNLLTRRSPAPWGGPEVTLFQHLLHMIEHLAQHKGQLFYYLKLLGKDVNTGNLWGM